MNLNPAELLDHVFNFLDAPIQNYGVYLYLVFVWLALLVIAWIFQRRLAAQTATGKLRRSSPQASSSRRDRRANHHRQSSASKLTKCGTAKTKQRIKHDGI